MITYFDMCAGIGGFRAGFDQAGGYVCIGHCEIDKHADAAYRRVHKTQESEVFYDDAKTINTKNMPDFNLLCAGFPCQAFSIAGMRKGFDDERGTLFFAIASVLEAKRPAYIILENVPGLLSHDGGRTFAVILDALCKLGYGIEWQVLNSKDFRVPQSRRRVYIIGYLDGRCAGAVLPFCGANPMPPVQPIGWRRDARIYDPAGCAKALYPCPGDAGGKTGAYLAGDGYVQTQDTALHIKEATKRGYKEAVPGDSVNLSYATQNKKRARVGKGIANTVLTGNQQGVVTPEGRIRRLMPRECLRLQGFTDTQIDRLLENASDTQAYKQAGNAVTVNVVHALAVRLKTAHEAIHAATEVRDDAA